ncbi:hypothetical protein EYF80_022508 [Liparis tanakae]|uniref:Uncharacterized protein n=1 Tax=Liparis tanakae TaxID=230148 RepID=A0A4Z2HN14_9TELE|nr:hypothetical protein EYF80_022508 [Liparis tanakae]
MIKPAVSDRDAGGGVGGHSLCDADVPRLLCSIAGSSSSAVEPSRWALLVYLGCQPLIYIHGKEEECSAGTGHACSAVDGGRADITHTRVRVCSNSSSVDNRAWLMSCYLARCMVTICTRYRRQAVQLVVEEWGWGKRVSGGQLAHTQLIRQAAVEPSESPGALPRALRGADAPLLLLCWMLRDRAARLLVVCGIDDLDAEVQCLKEKLPGHPRAGDLVSQEAGHPTKRPHIPAGRPHTLSVAF